MITLRKCNQYGDDCGVILVNPDALCFAEMIDVFTLLTFIDGSTRRTAQSIADIKVAIRQMS